MSLRTQAEADLSLTLEDSGAFGWPVTVTDPAGLSVSGLYAQTVDIEQTIDPETGHLINGRFATATLRIATLTANGLGLPMYIANRTSPGWRVTFDDINGNSYTFRVRQANPDRTLGVVVCMLEVTS